MNLWCTSCKLENFFVNRKALSVTYTLRGNTTQYADRESWLNSHYTKVERQKYGILNGKIPSQV